jgi:hypothetical protein
MLAAFVLAAAFACLFAVRTARHALYWGRHRDEAIRPWMSVPYVARSYRVPPHVLYRAINLEPRPRDRRPLRELALEQKRSEEELAEELLKAVADFRAHPERYPPPPPRRDGGRGP